MKNSERRALRRDRRRRRERAQLGTLDQRLKAIAERAREAAARMPPGEQRDELLRKAWQADNVREVDRWLRP